MDTEKIRVQGKATAGEYSRVLIRHQWKRLSLIVGLIMLVALFFALFIAKAKPSDPANDKRPIGIVVILILPIAVIGGLYLSIRRQAATVERESEDTTFLFDETGMEMINASSSGQVNWSSVFKVAESAEDFVFYPRKTMFFVVPKRFFESQEQITKLRLILAENLGDNAKLIA